MGVYQAASYTHQQTWQANGNSHKTTTTTSTVAATVYRAVTTFLNSVTPLWTTAVEVAMAGPQVIQAAQAVLSWRKDWTGTDLLTKCSEKRLEDQEVQAGKIFSRVQNYLDFCFY